MSMKIGISVPTTTKEKQYYLYFHQRAPAQTITWQLKTDQCPTPAPSDSTYYSDTDLNQTCQSAGVRITLLLLRRKTLLREIKLKEAPLNKQDVFLYGQI